MSDQVFGGEIFLLISSAVFIWLSVKSVKSVYRWIWPYRKEVLAIDTECVGAGPKGSISMLARVSIVTQDYKVYDKYVKPTRPVTDYRTFVSGIRPQNLINAEDFYKVRQQPYLLEREAESDYRLQEFIKRDPDGLFVRLCDILEVAKRLKNCILVGHDLKNDLNCLELCHPEEDIRDTSRYYLFKLFLTSAAAQEELNMMDSRADVSEDESIWRLDQAFSKVEKKYPQFKKPSLKLLAKVFLNKYIQIGEHSSVEDAATVMNLYQAYGKDWEAYLENQRRIKNMTEI